MPRKYVPVTRTLKSFMVYWLRDGQTTVEPIEGTGYTIISADDRRNGWPAGTLVIWNAGKPTIFPKRVWIRFDQIAGPTGAPDTAPSDPQESSADADAYPES